MALALRLFDEASEQPRDFAAELQHQTLGCRLRLERLGTRKALSQQQVDRVAESFSADRRLLAGTKRLLDTTHPAFRAVGRVQSAATSCWHAMTVPFPEPGIRLIRRDRVQIFDENMRGFQTKLTKAVAALQAAYPEMRITARHNLGSLYNPDEYRERIDESFSLTWDFPSFEVPEPLRRLHPEIYAQESERVRRRFDEALRLAEEDFIERLGGIVTHLGERLTGTDDGKPKVFRNSALLNLRRFIDDFRQLDIGSNHELQNLVSRAEQLIDGVRPDDLRTDTHTRTTVAQGLAQIQEAMDGLMVERPRRLITLMPD